MRNNNIEQTRSLFRSKGSYLRGYLTSTSQREKQDEENIQITLSITAAAEWEGGFAGLLDDPTNRYCTPPGIFRHLYLSGCLHPHQVQVTTYLGFWGEEGSAETVHVAQVDLYAGVGESELVEAGGAVTGTDVTLTREGRDGDGVLQLRLGQVVADPTINVALSTETKHTAAF